MQIKGRSFEAGRRHFLQTAAALVTGFEGGGSTQAQPATPSTVRDRLWVFCCPINSDYPNLHQRSVMSPVESAFYLGVPNIIMVQDHPRPGQEPAFKPFEQPFEQYTYALRPLKRVVWSVVGGSGVTDADERQQVVALAKRTPNFVGVYMDDFFTGSRDGKRASLTIEELRDLRQQLQLPSKKLRIYVTFYTRFLNLPLTDYMKLIDVLTLWTGDLNDLVDLELYLAAAEKLAPRSRKMLGCYLVNFAQKKSLPVSAMQFQCETGLRWLRQGRIDGMIFLGNTVMDLGYEAVDWTRDWIHKVGDTSL